MLFMGIGTWEPNQANAAIKKRLEMEAKKVELPAGVKALGEWGYVGGGKAFVLYDVEDPVVFMQLCMAWADIMKMEVYPVLERNAIAEIRNQLK